MTTYKKQSTLSWPDLWNHFGMSKDNAGRWETTESTQDYVKEFLSEIRSPSRSWPNSYASAMLRQKFARLVVEQEPELAIQIGIAE